MITYTAFNGVQLPLGNPTHEIGTGAAVVSQSSIVGVGIFDPWGSEQAPRGVRPIRAPFRITGTASEVTTTLYALQGLVGTRGLLYRRRVDTGATERIYARCLRVQADNDPHFNTMQDVSMEFMLMEEVWRGQAYTNEGGAEWDDGSQWDSGLLWDDPGTVTTVSTSGGTVTMDNNGNAPVRSVVVTVIPAGGNADTITVTYNNGDAQEAGWLFSDTVASGTALIVNGEALRVTNAGTAAYSDLTPNPDAWGAWAHIPVGGSTITVEWTGTATSLAIAFDYDEAWI